MNIKEIKFISQNVPTKRTPAQDDFTDKLYQIFKDKMIPISYRNGASQKWKTVIGSSKFTVLEIYHWEGS